MSDFNKPDLFVHPKFFNIIIDNYELGFDFNVYSLDDLRPSLTSNTGTSLAYHVGNDSYKPVSLRLEPYYRDVALHTSGSSAACTTYWFCETTPMYTLEHKNPRYVIWDRNSPLTICATRVDRVVEHELYVAVQRAKEWAYDIHETKSVVVFDLDSTLIDVYGRKLRYADRMLEYAKRVYDYVVLWSHGSPLHVDDNVQKLLTNDAHGDEIFDLVLRNSYGKPSAKNLLHLYNYFPGCNFAKAVLMDDSPYNWTPEYTRMIIPDRNLTTLKYAINLI